MTDEEYKLLQKLFTGKINSMEHRKNYIRYNEGFKDGLLIAKSVLHSFYGNKEVNK